jgi:Bacterial aa3 type cytochrome c oxidase subunit IV
LSGAFWGVRGGPDQGNHLRESMMATGNDMKFHNATYDRFLGLLKWSVPIIAVIAFTVVVLIA